MKRYSIILSLVLFNLKVFGLSFPEYPLSFMIEQSEFIVHGFVVDTFKTDSATKASIRQESRDKKYCWSGRATNTATIRIISVIKGRINQDTILIPYHSSGVNAIPDFELHDTLLLFLNKFHLDTYFGKTDSRYGVKSNYLDSYLKATHDYQMILQQPDSLVRKLRYDWLIDLTCIRELTWEGSSVLELLPDSIYDTNTKERLLNALIRFNTFQYEDENLIEIVSGFGYNLNLILTCLYNLELILDNTDKNFYLAIDLMEAINNMDMRKEYEQLIKKYWNYSLDKEKQTTVIRDFVEIASMHYAQQLV